MIADDGGVDDDADVVEDASSRDGGSSVVVVDDGSADVNNMDLIRGVLKALLEIEAREAAAEAAAAVAKGCAVAALENGKEKELESPPMASIPLVSVSSSPSSPKNDGADAHRRERRGQARGGGGGAVRPAPRKLSQILVDECCWHFVQSTKPTDSRQVQVRE